MRYRALDVYLGPKKRLVGRLFQYGTGSGAITRLIPDKRFWADDNAPVLRARAALWRGVFVYYSLKQQQFTGLKNAFKSST